MDVKATTTTTKDGDNIVLTISETQTMTDLELKQEVSLKQQTLSQLQSKLSELKAGLMMVIDIKDEGEEAKLADMMDKAEKIKEKRSCINGIKIIEKQIVNVEKYLSEVKL